MNERAEKSETMDRKRNNQDQQADLRHLSEDRRSVFLFCSGIDDVLGGSSKVAGIQVQMSFWARIFAKNGWQIMSFSEHQQTTWSDETIFVKRSSSWLCTLFHLQILLELNDCLKCIRRKPTMVITRGASRYLYFLVWLCRMKKVALVHFGASDSDFVPGNELLAGSKANRIMYQKSIKRIDRIVIQNKEQKEALKRYYGKDGLVMSNIWIPKDVDVLIKRYDAIWIANLRPLKRAEWFVRLSRELPYFRFAIVGGAGKQNYYDSIKTEAEQLNNLDFLGAQSFKKVDELVSQSRLLVCTSEFEGFPNTFLQAWAQDIPVVSTVNPSGVISEFGLGSLIQNEVELSTAVKELLTSYTLYDQCQKNIGNYFAAHHDADKAYLKVMETIGFNKHKQ